VRPDVGGGGRHGTLAAYGPGDLSPARRGKVLVLAVERERGEIFN